jgi:uncharacterized membrane protein
VIHLFTTFSGDTIAVFDIPEYAVAARSKPPFLHFHDERNLVVAVPELAKMFHYRNTVNGWQLIRFIDIEFEAISDFGVKQFVALTAGGKLHLIEKAFVQKSLVIVPKTLNGSKFVAVAGGGGWVAILEQSERHRRLHIYSNETSPAWRGVAWFAGFLMLAILIVLIRGRMDCGKLWSKVNKKKGQRREFKYV